ncbi:MAG: NAD(P)H-binding protein [Solirubrobacteraceae bacterium]
MDVLVMGATGNVGGALVQLLRARNVRVRAISREARTWPEGVQGVVGDANDPGSLVGAAAGMDGAFLMSGYASEVQLLADLGAGHAALLSSSSVPLADSGNAMAAYHRDSEEAVKASDAAWTIVRPCSMQSNVTRWKDQLDAGDVIRAPFADVAVAMTDPADVAAVLATALTEAGHAGETYRVSGPEALTPVDQVALLAEVLERKLRFEAVSDHEARATLPAQLGQAYADAQFDIFRDHPQYESEIQPTVERVLGRPPGRLRSWLERNRTRLL